MPIYSIEDLATKIAKTVLHSIHKAPKPVMIEALMDEVAFIVDDLHLEIDETCVEEYDGILLTRMVLLYLSPRLSELDDTVCLN